MKAFFSAYRKKIVRLRSPYAVAARMYVESSSSTRLARNRRAR